METKDEWKRARAVKCPFCMAKAGVECFSSPIGFVVNGGLDILTLLMLQQTMTNHHIERILHATRIRLNKKEQKHSD